jgi:hypothetical protein
MREVGMNNHAGKWTDLIHKLEASEPIIRADFEAIMDGYEGITDYPAAIFPKELTQVRWRAAFFVLRNI